MCCLSLQKSKGSQFLGMLKNYSLDDGGRGMLRKSKSKNVTFGPTKSMDDRFLSHPQANGMCTHWALEVG